MRPRPLSLPPSLRLVFDPVTPYSGVHGRRSSKDPSITISEVDMDTSRLLPQKGRHPRVRTRGQPPAVRRVSVPSRVSSISTTSSRTSDLFDMAADGSDSLRFGSEDEDSDTPDEDQQPQNQLRSYGIGGAGNIRTYLQPSHDAGSSCRGSTSF
jgi:hypothetical protein